MIVGRIGETHRETVWRDAFLAALPALVSGLLLRAFFLWKLPLGLVYQDTFDFLQTASIWMEKGEFVLQSKKTFLVPALYTLPFLLKIPALVAIPLAQHALGLFGVLLASLLCRCWFAHWRFLAPPATLLIAVNPHIVWFEHVLMAESLYVATSLFLAAAGTLYALRPGWGRFALLLLAAALQAGARPEGRVFLALGFPLLLFAHFKQPATLALRGGLYTAFAAAMLAATKTSQSGLLLLAAMLPMLPPDLRCEPELAPLLAPVRDDLAAASAARPYFPNAGYRKRVEAAARGLLAERKGVPPDDLPKEEVMALCSRAGKEIMLRNGWKMPGYAVAKFRFSQASGPSYPPDERYLHEKPLDALADSKKTLDRLGAGLAPGIPNDLDKLRERILASQRPEKMRWFDAWQDAWYAGVMAFRLPDARYANGGVDRGVPALHLLALAGVAGMAAFRRPAAFHLPWGALLVGMFFLIVTVASPRPRFSFVFEPFYAIYAFAALDLAISGIRRFFPGKP